MNSNLSYVFYGPGSAEAIYENVIYLADGTRAALACTPTGISLSRYYDGAWHSVWSK